MGTGRTLNKKPRTRPVKSEGERRRRQKVQKLRLTKLGMDAAIVAKMEPLVVRTLLKRPVKVLKAVAAKAALAAKPAVAAKKPAAKPAAVKKPAKAAAVKMPGRTAKTTKAKKPAAAE
jgi:hypothetical protein